MPLELNIFSVSRWILDQLVSPINVIMEFKNPTDVGFFYILKLNYG